MDTQCKGVLAFWGGTAWIVLEGTSGIYTSAHQKMYKEVKSRKRSPQTSAPLGREVGWLLSASPLHDCRLPAANMPVPAKMSMQTSLNKIGSVIKRQTRKTRTTL